MALQTETKAMISVLFYTIKISFVAVFSVFICGSGEFYIMLASSTTSLGLLVQGVVGTGFLFCFSEILFMRELSTKVQ